MTMRCHPRAAVLALAALPLAVLAPQSAPDRPPQTNAPAVLSIATVPLAGVSLSGSLSVADGRAVIGNNGSITAGDKTARVHLTRGGDLDVCATTTVHLSTDTTTPGGALMIALDRGAFEAHYTPGQYSDVLLTPDLRILISPPGQADLSIRVNNQGDTCVDNHGGHAPYVLASSLFDGGAYRIQPNQRVLFEHGSLHDVVDNEQEPCGCPSAQPLSVASAGTPGPNPAQPGEVVDTNKPGSKAEADNPFPLAESEGLAPPPPAPTKPTVAPGQSHAEVEAPLVYSGDNPPPSPVAPSPTSANHPAPATAAPPVAQAPPPPKPHTGFFAHIGHFFKRIFGGK